MKSIIQLSFILIIILFFTTCKKEIRHTFVEGIAQDYYTKQPIADARVELKGPGGDQYNIITTVYTDANGHFEFEKFRAEKTEEYYVNINKGNYSSYNKDGSANVVTGKKNKLKPSIAARSNIVIFIKNITPYNTEDKICLDVDYPKHELSLVNNGLQDANLPFCYYGENNRIGLGWTNSCNTTFKIKWSVTKNNITNYYEIPMILKPETKDTLITLTY
jgi:hypothetical protein